MASLELPIIAPISVTTSSFTAVLDGVSNVYPLPNEDSTVLVMKPKSFLSIDVNSKSSSDFSPKTVLLQIESSSGKSYSLPMQRTESGFHVEVSPSRSDLASTFNYISDQFKLTFLCGDKLLPAPLRIPLMSVKMEFGNRPKEPVYSIYSKTLMYATEMSTGPMKEIEHVFKPENKNPFFMFPVVFSLVIVALLVVLVITWLRIGFDWRVSVRIITDL